MSFFNMEPILKFPIQCATSCTLLACVALAGLAQAQQPVLPSPTALPSPKPGITPPLQTLRALLSNPAVGGMTPADSLSVAN